MAAEDEDDYYPDSQAGREEDPWEHEDPWGSYANRGRAQSSRGPIGAPPGFTPRPRQSRSFMTGDGTAVAGEPVGAPNRVANDLPPTWDGADPDKQFEPYMKLLSGWLKVTRTPKNQQGLVIMTYATKDLRVIINELDIETLTGEDSGETVHKHIANSFQWYADRKLAKATEAAIFDKKAERQKGESFLMYCTRKHILLKEFEKQFEWEQFKGYMLLRGAHLSERAADALGCPI